MMDKNVVVTNMVERNMTRETEDGGNSQSMDKQDEGDKNVSIGKSVAEIAGDTTYESIEENADEGHVDLWISQKMNN